jgi:hypothetical protein
VLNPNMRKQVLSLLSPIYLPLIIPKPERRIKLFYRANQNMRLFTLTSCQKVSYQPN